MFKIVYCFHIVQWLEEEFLPYLEEWEKSVNNRPGFTKSQKKRMLLSPETLLGLKITSTFDSLNS